MDLAAYAQEGGGLTDECTITPHLLSGRDLRRGEQVIREYQDVAPHRHSSERS
jgi:hypothetical protein